MTDEVKICNAALGLAEGETITSLDQKTLPARLCKHYFPITRDALLRGYKWNFAAARSAIPARTEKPPFEYANAFALPNDCLRVRTVFGYERAAWVVEGRSVLANAGGPLYLKYTARISDPMLYDAMFVEAFAMRLAANIAPRLTTQRNRAAELRDAANVLLRDTKKVDAREMGVMEPPPDSWLATRQGGVSGS